jgi:hypothetical protein
MFCNFGGFGYGQAPRAFFIKIEAQRVRASLNGGLRVGQVRDPANFDPCAHFGFSLFVLRLTRLSPLTA